MQPGADRREQHVSQRLPSLSHAGRRRGWRPEALRTDVPSSPRPLPEKRTRLLCGVQGGAVTRERTSPAGFPHMPTFKENTQRHLCISHVFCDDSEGSSCLCCLSGLKIIHSSE